MIDLHSDTIYRLWEESREGESLKKNTFMIDLERLEKGHVTGQCFALFTPMYEHRVKGKDLSCWEVVNQMHDTFSSEIALAGIPQLKNIEETNDGKPHAILTTEEGSILEGDISRLQILKEWGVKIFGFTWNYENELAYPNSEDSTIMNKGLKEKGIEALEECERLGILVDVSHLNDGGFYDIASRAKKPFIATHSNSRAMTDVTRNLTDDMLRVLADHGGVAGLNLCPAFLRTNDSTERKSRVEDMVRHIKHIVEIAGEDVVAIGSDLDGIGGELEINGPDKFYLLENSLVKAGFSSYLIDKLFKDNAYRVFKEVQA